MRLHPFNTSRPYLASGGCGLDQHLDALTLDLTRPAGPNFTSRQRGPLAMEYA